MKKFIITIVLALVCMSSFAQTYRFRSSEYAFGKRNSYGNVVWGKWERCRVLITIDFDNDYIKVYSDREQDYVIVDAGESYQDRSGGSNVDFTAIDEEGIECDVRLRIQRDGTAQLYAFYNNIAWVYSGLNRL